MFGRNVKSDGQALSIGPWHPATGAPIRQACHHDWTCSLDGGIAETVDLPSVCRGAPRGVGPTVLAPCWLLVVGLALLAPALARGAVRPAGEVRRGLRAGHNRLRHRRQRPSPKVLAVDNAGGAGLTRVMCGEEPLEPSQAAAGPQLAVGPDRSPWTLPLVT
jgi:hypothetical protein